MKIEIQSQNELEVYASDVGYVCIYQPDPYGEHSLVLIAIQNVDTLCQMLQEAKAQAVINRADYLSGKVQQ